MLYTYNITAQDVAVSGLLPFGVVGIQTGCTATATQNGASLNRCGIYKIEFSASANAPAAGNVQVEMYINGTVYTGAITTAYSGGAGESAPLSFAVLVRVPKNTCCNTANVPMSVTFRNTGVAATYTNTALVVTKVA